MSQYSKEEVAQMSAKQAEADAAAEVKKFSPAVEALKRQEEIEQLISKSVGAPVGSRKFKRTIRALERRAAKKGKRG